MAVLIARTERTVEREMRHEAQEAELKARREEREAERARKEEERKRDMALAHMRKVRALEERHLVHVGLVVGDGAAAAAAAAEDDPMDADAPPPPPPPRPAETPRVKLAFSFPTTQLSTVKLADGLERIMNQYNQQDKSQVFKKGHPWLKLMEAVELGLQQTIGEKWAVRTSMGCGGWARVPWVAVSHPTENTQHGLYLQFLFRADMTGVYLCLGQGTMKLKQAFGSAEAYAHLQAVGSVVREKCKDLLSEEAGFDLAGKIDLRSGSSGLAGDYEKGCIISRLYERRDVPTEATLITDIHSLLDAYSAILDDEAYVAVKGPADERLKAAGKGGRTVGASRTPKLPSAASIASAKASAKAGQKRRRSTGGKKGDDDFDSNDDGGDDDDLLPADGGAKERMWSSAAKPNTKKDADEARLKAGTPAERCAVVLELLGKRQDGFWFAEPVTDEIAPGYSDEIETPMDYQTAAEKLAAGAYADGAAAFAADVHLIYANARKFNYSDKSPCHVAATAAGAALEKMLDVAFGDGKKGGWRGGGPRAPAKGSSVEVEVEEEGGTIVWKAGRVKKTLPGERFVAYPNDDAEFTEEYGLEEEGKEWRRV